MLLQILVHTPRWVFVLFAVLVAFGARQLLGSTASPARITLLPVAMTGLSIFGVLSAFGDAPGGLAAWTAAALLVGAVVLRRGVPAGTRYDAAARRFHIAGSALPLALMMGIFVTKYGVGVLLALHPALRHDAGFALGASALYGAFSGVFAARALRLWRLALRRDVAGRGLRAGQPA